jgi:hypothetical protein
MALGSVGKPAIDERQAKLIQSMYQGTELGQGLAGFAEAIGPRGTGGVPQR